MQDVLSQSIDNTIKCIPDLHTVCRVTEFMLTSRKCFCQKKPNHCIFKEYLKRVNE